MKQLGSAIKQQWAKYRVLFLIFTCSLKFILRDKWQRVTRVEATRIMRETSRRLLQSVKAQITTKVIDRTSLKWDRPIIFMSNHQSLFDLALIHATILGDLRALPKQQLFKIPLFGRALKIAECISVDRENTRNSLRLLDTVRDKLNSGVMLLTFPEGTRSSTGRLLPFKYGVFRMAREVGALIVPITVNGTRNVLPNKSSRLVLNQKVSITIEKAIDASKYRQEQLKELVFAVHEAIAQHLPRVPMQQESV